MVTTMSVHMRNSLPHGMPFPTSIHLVGLFMSRAHPHVFHMLVDMLNSPPSPHMPTIMKQLLAPSRMFQLDRHSIDPPQPPQHSNNSHTTSSSKCHYMVVACMLPLQQPLFTMALFIALAVCPTTTVWLKPMRLQESQQGAFLTPPHNTRTSPGHRNSACRRMYDASTSRLYLQNHRTADIPLKEMSISHLHCNYAAGIIWSYALVLDARQLGSPIKEEN